MTTAVKLLPIIAGRKDGYWHGSGRYERGDRRDQRLSHSTYGQRVDQARIRRVLAMLAASCHQIDPDIMDKSIHSNTPFPQNLQL